MWLALDPVDAENGCLRYVDGSHLRGYPPSVKRESQAGGSWVPEYIPRAVFVSVFDETWLTTDRPVK